MKMIGHFWNGLEIEQYMNFKGEITSVLYQLLNTVGITIHEYNQKNITGIKYAFFRCLRILYVLHHYDQRRHIIKTHIYRQSVLKKFWVKLNQNDTHS